MKNVITFLENEIAAQEFDIRRASGDDSVGLFRVHKDYEETATDTPSEYRRKYIGWKEDFITELREAVKILWRANDL